MIGHGMIKPWSLRSNCAEHGPGLHHRRFLLARTSGMLLGLALLAPPQQLFADIDNSAPVVRLSVPQATVGASPQGVHTLLGVDSGYQMIVLGQCADGREIDLTQRAEYTAEPSGIVEVDPLGWVTPLAEGSVTVIARFPQLEPVKIALEVGGIVNDPPVNFANQVVPVFTKYGCNGGGCHGKSGGQNGFRLSLLGFEPAEDYQWLLKETRGRRLFPAAPERSLLLMKATGALPHGGGSRFEIDSPSYRLLARWIAQGMPFGASDAARVERIEVRPAQRLMRPGETQQLSIWAHYTDGRVEDVTRTTQLEVNDAEMAEVDGVGHLQVRDRPGMVSLMARYQGQVAVFRATIPLGGDTGELPSSRGLVDDHVFAQWQRLGLPPSAQCDDSTFLRRVTIDIAGRLPTLVEAQDFLADSRPDKRSAWIDYLLDSECYADHFASKWNAILRNKRRSEDDKSATFAFHRWVRESLYQNKPYDQFVRELLTASGDLTVAPAVSWYRELSEPAAMVEDASQLFLGLRIQCARCHHHPFEKWSQQDYYGMAAFFSRVGRRQGPGQMQVVHQLGAAAATHPKTGQAIPPAGLDSAGISVPQELDPRHELAEWMTDGKNPFFARSLVNRYWKHFFSRGIVDPEDDMRVTNPATNPELLAALADDFVAHAFDLKHLVRTICNSATYQLSSLPNEHNQSDKQSFSRYYPRRLSAETLLDAIDAVTGVPSSFPGMPAGTRAMQLPDTGFDSYFLTVFGRPESSSACECERSSDANLAQSLHLLNSSDLQSKLSADQGRAAQWALDEQRATADKIAELYLVCLARYPAPDELAAAQQYLERAGTERRRAAFEDLVWALINTKEFLFNH
jgi:hypothetical protein